MESEETDEGEATESSEEMQEILGIMEHLIVEGLEQFESRLNKKIDDIKEDLNSIDRRAIIPRDASITGEIGRQSLAHPICIRHRSIPTYIVHGMIGLI